MVSYQLMFGYCASLSKKGASGSDEVKGKWRPRRTSWCNYAVCSSWLEDVASINYSPSPTPPISPAHDNATWRIINTSLNPFNHVARNRSKCRWKSHFNDCLSETFCRHFAKECLIHCFAVQGSRRLHKIRRHFTTIKSPGDIFSR